MAEIKIEKKSPVWPWILLAVALIAVLIYIFAFHDDDNEVEENRTEQTTEEPAATGQVAPRNSTVVAYVSFVKDDPNAMGLDHAFTNEALSRLINATHAMADAVGHDVQRDTDEARTLADQITRDPFETTHANSIRKSAETLGNALQNIQQKAFPDLAGEAGKVQNAATAIDPDVLTLDQKEDVKGFFRESADLLEKMNNHSPQI